MRRRDLLKYAGATALAAPFVRAARADTGPVKVGVVGAKTGPLAPGAAVTHFPPWRLWAHEVNAAARGIGLVTGFDIGRATGGAKTAMHAIENEFVVNVWPMRRTGGRCVRIGSRNNGKWSFR